MKVMKSMTIYSNCWTKNLKA